MNAWLTLAVSMAIVLILLAHLCAHVTLVLSEMDYSVQVCSAYSHKSMVVADVHGLMPIGK